MNSILTKMKHNKTPGIDGITVEFLKVFWGSLKYYILNAINFCFEKGIMPPSLRQCIIVCLPKGNKDRTLLKNWRPISLLSVIYKLASSVIADRLKRNLDQIISKSQTGFVPGRHMSDSTRLIYDIMFHAERENKDGLLLIIDFDSMGTHFRHLTKAVASVYPGITIGNLTNRIKELSLTNYKVALLFVGTNDLTPKASWQW